MAESSRARRGSRTGKIADALAILKALNVPKGQQNERSALTLLALLGMTPRTPWRDATDPMLGITEMMERFRKDYDKRYAPNTRETVRRYTVHQFVQMGLVLANPDDPARPVNSPDNRYQVSATLLKLARTYGSREWADGLAAFLEGNEALRRLQSQQRQMALISVTLPDGQRLHLTPGGQNELVRRIIEEFCPRFTPGGIMAYVGDTGDKQRLVGVDYLRGVGVVFDEQGKMPDLVVHLPRQDWLVLIEAVTTHGPIGLKRRNELKDLFRAARLGLVFVTAFLTRRAMTRFLAEIAWETEVRVAEAPSHIIHFNGERFLGPYD